MMILMSTLSLLNTFIGGCKKVINGTSRYILILEKYVEINIQEDIAR